MTGAAAAAVTVSALAAVPAASANTPVNGHASAAPVSTASSFVTVTGGTGPYSYLWTQTDAAPLWSITSPTASNSIFTCTDPAGSTAHFHCRVTDSAGTPAVTYTNDVEANATIRGSLVVGGGGAYP